jgi:hypothetical protein
VHGGLRFGGTMVDASVAEQVMREVSQRPLRNCERTTDTRLGALDEPEAALPVKVVVLGRTSERAL